MNSLVPRGPNAPNAIQSHRLVWTIENQRRVHADVLQDCRDDRGFIAFHHAPSEVHPRDVIHTDEGECDRHTHSNQKSDRGDQHRPRHENGAPVGTSCRPWWVLRRSAPSMSARSHQGVFRRYRDETVVDESRSGGVDQHQTVRNDNPAGSETHNPQRTAPAETSGRRRWLRRRQPSRQHPRSRRVSVLERLHNAFRSSQRQNMASTGHESAPQFPPERLTEHVMPILVRSEVQPELMTGQPNHPASVSDPVQKGGEAKQKTVEDVDAGEEDIVSKVNGVPSDCAARSETRSGQPLCSGDPKHPSAERGTSNERSKPSTAMDDILGDTSCPHPRVRHNGARAIETTTVVCDAVHEEDLGVILVGSHSDNHNSEFVSLGNEATEPERSVQQEGVSVAGSESSLVGDGLTGVGQHWQADGMELSGAGRSNIGMIGVPTGGDDVATIEEVTPRCQVASEHDLPVSKDDAGLVSKGVLGPNEGSPLHKPSSPPNLGDMREAENEDSRVLPVAVLSDAMARKRNMLEAQVMESRRDIMRLKEQVAALENRVASHREQAVCDCFANSSYRNCGPQATTVGCDDKNHICTSSDKSSTRIGLVGREARPIRSSSTAQQRNGVSTCSLICKVLFVLGVIRMAHILLRSVSNWGALW